MDKKINLIESLYYNKKNQKKYNNDAGKLVNNRNRRPKRHSRIENQEAKAGTFETRYRLPHKNNVRFVFTSCCFWEGSWLINVICVCLRRVVTNTYCVEFLLCFCSSCVPYVSSFFGLSFFHCPFGIL